MQLNRRQFCLASAGAATSAAAMPLLAFAATEPADQIMFEQIEKSIKASFGGGFKVLKHIENQRLNYAAISHAGKQYLVASKDLYDWQVISSKI